MQIQNKTYNQNFTARFLQSDDLKKVADYAVEKGKFEKLNQARKNIATSCLTTRLFVKIGQTDKNYPFISFDKFVPKKGVIVPQTMDDYVRVKTTTFTTEKHKNILKHAYETIIKMGNSVPYNKVFRKTVYWD